MLHCHLFFRKKNYFFECLYFSEYDIWMFLCFSVEKGTIHYVRTQLWGWGVTLNVHSSVEGEGGATTYKKYLHYIENRGLLRYDYITFYYLIYSLYTLIYFYITDNVTFLKNLHQHISYSGNDRRSNSDYENYRKYGSWKVSFSSYRVLKKGESQISIL